MAQESFTDKEVAKILNENFISIKVDREERPDIDNIYMEICQSLTGSGGWPLSIFMTPNKKPFYAGTYFPKYSTNNHIGFIYLLNVINKKWKENKSELINSSEEITKIIKSNLENNEQHILDEKVIDKCFSTLKRIYDPIYGGFGTKPKFPTPHNLLFLLRYGIYKNEQKAIEMVENTLIKMYKGGIFDHIGYGFSRYSVDNKWLIPHFEKMLYDNALLIIVYAEAYQLTHKKIYKDITEKIISFVLNNLKSNNNSFYTAIDADSEGEEGKYYTWSLSELQEILTKEELIFITDLFNISNNGNFNGKNILNLIHLDNDTLLNIDNKKLDDIRKKLNNKRISRIHPHVDDKILTANNAMMIIALTISGKIFNNSKYITLAEDTFAFISKNLITKESRILARFRDGEAKYLGYLEDYAYLVWSLIELFLTTGKNKYINLALEFNNNMIKLFLDNVKGGFFHTGKDSEELIMKTKPIYDGAIPSGNSVLTMNLLRLSEITDDIKLTQLAKKQFNYFSQKLQNTPHAYTHMLSAYLFYKAIKRKIVLVADKNSKELKNICDIYNTKYLPFTTNVKLYKDEIKNTKIFHDYDDNTEKISAYICENFQCNDPIFDEQEIITKLKELTNFY